MEGDLTAGSATPEPRNPGVDPDTVERVIAGQWSGPLPPPAALEQFERSAPGAADRILGMAEQEEMHRHEQEREMLQSDKRARTRGQWMAFLLAMAVVLGGIWLIDRGRQVEGLIALLSPLAILIGAFLYGKERAG
jgi:uncharacterized membrane protein